LSRDSSPATEQSLEWEQLDPAALPKDERYRLITAAVIPRPIAFVTTLGPGGIINAAPFSQFVIIAIEPLLLGFVCEERPDGTKDTLANIRKEKEFVINSVPQHLAEIVQQCAGFYPPEISEADLLGLDLLPSNSIRTPRVAASKVQFECQLHRLIEFGERHTTLVVGEVLLIVSEAGLIEGSRIDPARYAPLGRIAGRSYCRLTDLFSV